MFLLIMRIEEEWSSSLTFSFSGMYEMIMVVMICVLASMLLGLKLTGSEHDTFFKLKILFPLLYDLLFMSITSTFARMAVCLNGPQYLVLWDGSTCSCLNRYPLFAAIGALGFSVIYFGALEYKSEVEQRGEGLNFRYQPSFQILMVCARASNPFFSALVSMAVLYPSGDIGGILIACIYLVMVVMLLKHSYQYQPCMGSGLIPNNIRALSFSSSAYLTLSIIIVGILKIIFPALDEKVYYILMAVLSLLPMVWILAWKFNSKRAIIFHIPRCPISELLDSNEERVVYTGTIAALHVLATNVSKKEAGKIILRLNSMLVSHRISAQLQIAVAQTLWHMRFPVQKCVPHVFYDEVESEKRPDNNFFGLLYKDVDNPLRKKRGQETVEYNAEILRRRHENRSIIRTVSSRKRAIAKVHDLDIKKLQKHEERLTNINPIDYLIQDLVLSKCIAKNQELLSCVFSLMYHKTPSKTTNVAAALFLMELYQKI